MFHNHIKKCKFIIEYIVISERDEKMIYHELSDSKNFLNIM